MSRPAVIRTVQVLLPPEARAGELWSVCGKRLANSAQARVHAAKCCDVGRVRE